MSDAAWSVLAVFGIYCILLAGFLLGWFLWDIWHR